MSAPTCTAERLASALRALTIGTRLEPGCQECLAWTTDVGDDVVDVHYEERWASEAEMATRVRSERFTQLLEVLEGAPTAPRVQFDFVARQQGLEYVEAVRRGER